MKRFLIVGLALAAVTALAEIALAQSALQGRPSYGTFGPRTLGQPLAPRFSQGSNLQRGPSGNFLYRGRIDGSTNFSAPWRRIDPYVLLDNPRYVAAVQASQQQALIQPSLPATELQPAPAAAVPQTVPTIDQLLTPEAAAMAADMAAAATPRREPALATAANVPLAQPPAVPMAHSATLSERVTRMARQRGMLESERIDVSVGGSIARLEGAVRTARDRQVLANVLGLEPNIDAIDNRLVARGNSAGSGR